MDMVQYQLVLEKAINTDPETVPLPRSGHRCATDGVFLYCFGGFNPNTYDKLFSRNIWCYHLSSKRWYKVITDGYAFGSAPRCVASSIMVLYRGWVIVFGGSGFPFGTRNSNKLFKCDLKEQRWYYYSVMPEFGNVIPMPGYGQGVVIGPDKCIYIFGGTKGAIYNNDLHKFDFENRMWELITCRNPPLARYRHEMASLEGGFVVIGGYGVNGACPLDKLPVYSYADNSWEEVQCERDPVHGFPEPRRAHSCVKFENNVYVCGGFDEESNDRVYNDIWKLNVQTFTWTRISQVLPHPTYFHSAAVTSEGCMYIFGGIEWIGEDEKERTNHVLKMWLVIPPLEKICWQALCDTIPQGGRLDTNKLGGLGVPKYLLTSYEAQFLVGLKNNDM